MSPVIFAVLLVAVYGAAVKNQPANGYGAAPETNYYQPSAPVQTNYVQVPVFVPPPKPQLVHTHLCARDVGYTTYGGKNYRSRRPTERSCDDVYMPSGSSGQRKDAMKNCNKCCKSTARLNGFSTDDIRGFITVIDKQSRCTCCAPALPTAPFPYSLPLAQPSYGSAQPAANYPAQQQTPIGYGAAPASEDAQAAAPSSY